MPYDDDEETIPQATLDEALDLFEELPPGSGILVISNEIYVLDPPDPDEE